MVAGPSWGGDFCLGKGGVFAVHKRGLPSRAYPQERLRNWRRLVLNQQVEREQTNTPYDFFIVFIGGSLTNGAMRERAIGRNASLPN